VAGKLGARGCQEGQAFRRSDRETARKPLSQLFRGAPLVSLDLLERRQRTASLIGQVALREVKSLAPSPDPVTEGMRLLHEASISPAPTNGQVEDVGWVRA
jgi:hypothetical protein